MCTKQLSQAEKIIQAERAWNLYQDQQGVEGTHWGLVADKAGKVEGFGFLAWSCVLCGIMSILYGVGTWSIFVNVPHELETRMYSLILGQSTLHMFTKSNL